MKDGVIFKKVLFGGFHQGDVLAYIEALEADKENMKLTFQDEVEKLRKELEEASMQQYVGYETAGDSELVKNLQESLKNAERKQIELKSQLCQAEIQRTELIKKLNNAPSEDSFNANLKKLQSESRQIVVQQRREAEGVLAKVRVSVSALVNRTNEKLSQRESELSRVHNEIELQTKRIMALEADIRQKEEEISRLQNDISEATAYIRAMENLNEEQKRQIEDLTKELASEREIRYMKESVPEDKVPLVVKNEQEQYADISEEVPVQTESGADMTEMDDLDSIFAEASELLDSSEKNAQGKIIKMSKRVG